MWNIVHGSRHLRRSGERKQSQLLPVKTVQYSFHVFNFSILALRFERLTFRTWAYIVNTEAPAKEARWEDGWTLAAQRSLQDNRGAEEGGAVRQATCMALEIILSASRSLVSLTSGPKVPPSWCSTLVTLIFQYRASTLINTLHFTIMKSGLSLCPVACPRLSFFQVRRHSSWGHLLRERWHQR